MANVEINDLTAKTTASETDELEIQETAGGLSKKITRANFIPDSSETVKGKVELATTSEATTGTDTARAVTPAGVKAVADTKANTSHSHAASDVTSGLLANGRIATGTPDGTKFLRDDQVWTALPGGGDMLAATYDPQAIGDDAFDVDNHTNGTTNKVYTATEKTKLAGIATGATANDTDANLKARANHTGTQTASTISDFSTAADARITAAAGSSIASLSGGKVPTSQLPAISLTTVQTAVSQAAQLALTAEAGDVVVRTDENKTYMHNGGTAGTMADYTLLNTPPDAVTSVNGQTGVVSLAKSDVGLSNVDNTSDASKPVSTATQTALDTKVTGPASATDEGIARFDSTTGKLIQNSAKATLDDDGNLFLKADTYQALTLSDAAGDTTLDFTLDKTNDWTQGADEVIFAPGGVTPPPGISFLNNASDAALLRIDTANNQVEFNADVTGLSKADVGLPNVDNTSDATKDAATTTLTNKTLTTPTIGSFTNATHTHQNAAGGGTLDAAAIAAGTIGTARLGSGSASASTYLRGDQTWATIAGGGQTLVTKTVAPSGGDYTTLGAALAAASAGWTIYVLDGTYTESAISSSLNNITIIGQGREAAIIDMGANAFTLSGTNCHVEGIKFTTTTSLITISGAGSELVNCHITKTGGTTGCLAMTGAGCMVRGNQINSTNSAAVTHCSFGGKGSLITENYFNVEMGSIGIQVAGTNLYPVFSNNYCYLGSAGSGTGFKTTGGAVAVTGNTFDRQDASTGTVIQANGSNRMTFTGNIIREGIKALDIVSLSRGTFTGNFFIRQADVATSLVTIDANGGGIAFNGNVFYDSGTAAGTAATIFDSNNSTTLPNIYSGNNIFRTATGSNPCMNVGQAAITGNTFVTSGTVGVTLSRAGCTVSGNYFSVPSGNDVLCGASYQNIVGNNFTTQKTTPINFSTFIGINAYNNTGAPPQCERRTLQMKNTSGGALNAGDVVVLKAVAAGNEVTTTTTGGDNKVFGMSEEAPANNAFGYVLIEGHTTLLKADGTTDIAIGDFLTPFTTAGIVKKAAAADTAIAVALEAFTTDASTGVLDALIIRPRLI